MRTFEGSSFSLVNICAQSGREFNRWQIVRKCRICCHPQRKRFVTELCVLRTFGGVDFSLTFICVQSVSEFLWDRLRASIRFPLMPKTCAIRTVQWGICKQYLPLISRSVPCMFCAPWVQNYGSTMNRSTVEIRYSAIVVPDACVLRTFGDESKFNTCARSGSD